MLWIKITVLAVLLGGITYFYRQHERKKSAIRGDITILDLHRSRGLNDLAIAAFCSRLGERKSNIAALVDIIAIARNHVASLEGLPSGKQVETSGSKSFFNDAKKIYVVTADEARLLEGLQSYMYREQLSAQETVELKDTIAKLEAAFDGTK